MAAPILTDVSSPRGAPMGRMNRLPSDEEPTAFAERMYLRPLRWVDGDYDEGGAYWGRGSVPGECIWWAYSLSDEWGEVQVFVRAVGREQAKELVRVWLPLALFYY